MKDSAKDRIASIEAKLEELDKLSSDMTEDSFTFIVNDIRTHRSRSCGFF